MILRYLWRLLNPKHDKTGPVYVFNELAIKGYDPVAYFREGRPRKGKSRNEYQWGGVKWRFYTMENRHLFITNPEKYIPQFGGFCAWGMKEGYKAKTKPETCWTLVEGNLYFNYNRKYQNRWRSDKLAYIDLARTNWEHLNK